MDMCIYIYIYMLKSGVYTLPKPHVVYEYRSYIDVIHAGQCVKCKSAIIYI